MGYATPNLHCDIVMKGGITSGVVYPPAVTRLASEFRFHNVGGTSAGAIAAAATAAAEFGRIPGPHAEQNVDQGFERLDTMSKFLGDDSHLFELFQPQDTTRPFFWLLDLALSGQRGRPLAALPLAALRFLFGWIVILGAAIPGIALIAISLWGRPWSGVWQSVMLPLVLIVTAVISTWLLTRWLWKREWLKAFVMGVVLATVVVGTVTLEQPRLLWGLAFAYLVLVIGVYAGAVAALAKRAMKVLPENMYGLCSGGVPTAGAGATPPNPATDDRRKPDAHYPLTYWMADEFDALAGIGGANRPVSVSDLRGLEGFEAPDGPDRTLTMNDAIVAGLVAGRGLSDQDRVLRAGDLEITSAALNRKPLTFGDLDAAGVTLRTIGTNLTHGRPYRLPLSTGVSFHSYGYFFDPGEFRDLFPGYVVDWLESHPPERRCSTGEVDWRDWQILCRLMEPLVPLPDPTNVPILLAARMSLSFPILLSAIPLHAIDWSLKANQDARKAWRQWAKDQGENWGPLFPTDWKELPESDHKSRFKPTRCWFSDGGISSNFPVHFFDAPLPRWPTFGLNLREPHPDHPIDAEKESENVWLPDESVAGQHLQWREVSGVPRFLRLIADTMQNWTDSTQMRIHGYWDRVAHISMGDNEGGMNLNMTGPEIMRLGKRGNEAARQLADRFRVTGSQPEDALGWDFHRWLRYRSSMELLEGFLASVRAGFEGSPQGEARAFDELIGRARGVEPRNYEFSNQRQRDFAQEQTKALVELSVLWHDFATDDGSFRQGAPKPRPELRISPPI